MKVKICGITCLEDARTALEVGADLLGFNFYPPSPRAISPETCASILVELRKGGFEAQMVGVFVNETPRRIWDILDYCGLDLAQLSGDEAPNTLEVLQGRAFKAIRPLDLPDAVRQACAYAQNKFSPTFLVDAYSLQQYGGTGQTGDWQVASMLSGRWPILLAGGLTPDNVAAAIRQVNPWGVDVASGVESRLGHKDPQKIVEFIKAANLRVEEA